jgi:RNA polymerase sigma factor (sigma-70 family)
MPATFHQLLRRLRRAAAPPDADSDAVLLDRFVRRRDEAAFAALLARHGPLVLGVCRRVLGDSHAAEDAFQATFLVLARRAPAVNRPDALAGWLCGVARRVALKARGARPRSQGLADAPEPPDPRPDPLAELTARDLLVALEQEVQRLPQGCRLAVTLVCLEGLSQEEAARRLGWTAGSVKGRLERGRKRLHARLTRRGLSLPAALAAVEASRRAAAAGVPARLAQGTGQAALAGAAGKSAAAPGAAALAEGTLRDMALTKLKIVAALLGLAAVAAIGLAFLALPAQASLTPAAQPPPAAEGPPAAQAPPAPAPALVSELWWLTEIDAVGGTIKVVACDPQTRQPYARPDAVPPCDVRVAAGADIRIDGKPAPFKDLVPGIPIRMRIDSWSGTGMGKLRFGGGTVTRVETVGDRSVGGVVRAVDARAGNVTVRDGRAVTRYRVVKGAEVAVDGRRGTLQDLKAGMSVVLRLSAVYPRAHGVAAVGPKVECTIRSTDKGQRKLTVELRKPRLLVPGLTVAPAAPILLDGKEATLADLRAGMDAVVQLAAEADRNLVLGVTALRGRDKED